MGDFLAAELSIGANTTIIAAAVKAAYLPTFTMASLRVIFSSLTSMLLLFSKCAAVFLVTGCWVRVSGFGFLVSGCWFLVAGSWFRVSGFGFRVSGYWLLVSGFWFLV